MVNPNIFNATEAIKKTQDLDIRIYTAEVELQELRNELASLKKQNATKISIPWKESILYCLGIIDDTEKDKKKYVLRTASFLSNCVAWNNGVDVSKELRNNVSSTLSMMHKNKEIGRLEKNGKKYYGLKEYFTQDLKNIKEKYMKAISLAA